jgi:hypothetical protein
MKWPELNNELLSRMGLWAGGELGSLGSISGYIPFGIYWTQSFKINNKVIKRMIRLDSQGNILDEKFQ